jgi:hypothetical protein
VAKSDTEVAKMNSISRQALAAFAVLVCALGTSAPANAQFVATICNDIQCTGGDDFIVQDGGALDTAGGVGAISFSVAAFGYSFLVNTAQSKPMVGSAGAPQLDLTFTATTGTAPTTTVFLNTSDIGFTMAGASSLLTLGGTNSGESGSVTGRVWGGTSNTALLFSGANLFGSISGLTGPRSWAARPGRSRRASIPTRSPSAPRSRGRPRERPLAT